MLNVSHFPRGERQLLIWTNLQEKYFFVMEGVFLEKEAICYPHTRKGLILYEIRRHIYRQKVSTMGRSK